MNTTKSSKGPDLEVFKTLTARREAWPVLFTTLRFAHRPVKLL
jgi:hypothetical protein